MRQSRRMCLGGKKRLWLFDADRGGAQVSWEVKSGASGTEVTASRIRAIANSSKDGMVSTVNTIDVGPWKTLYCQVTATVSGNSIVALSEGTNYRKYQSTFGSTTGLKSWNISSYTGNRRVSIVSASGGSYTTTVTKVWLE